MSAFPSFADKVTRVDLKPGQSPGALYPVDDILKTGRYAPLDKVRPPAIFEKNIGQGNAAFPFLLRSRGHAVGFWPGGFTAVASRYTDVDGKVESYAIQLQWLNAKSPVLQAGVALPSKIRTAQGSNKSSWLQTAPSYSSLDYANVWDGVTMSVHGEDGRLSYGFAVNPQAKLSNVKIALRGAKNLAIDSKGNLVMEGEKGKIVQTKPRFFQLDSQGGRKELSGRYVVLATDAYGFEVDNRDMNLELLVDPDIVFTTYYGGTGNDGTLANGAGAADLHGQGYDLAVSASGKIYLVGTTTSADFPLTAEGSINGGTSNAFVAKFDPAAPPSAQLAWATFVGGSTFERGVSVALDANENVYVAGCTTSADFPVTAGVVEPAVQNSVGYLAKLDVNGVLLAATLLGHSLDHHPASIQVSRATSETSEFVYVAGTSDKGSQVTSGDGVQGGFQVTLPGGRRDGFVGKLDLALSQWQYFTYLGGTRDDRIMDLAVTEGFAYVTGSTTSFDFPSTPFVLQQQHSQVNNTAVDCAATSTTNGFSKACFDAFVTRIEPSGAALRYSTFFGGPDEDYGRGIGLKGFQATVTGARRPTTGDATVIHTARLDSSAEGLIWQTPLTARRFDHGEEMVIDPLGRAHVVGTASIDGLTTSDTSFHGGDGDIFYARYADQTGLVEFFTYLGGSGGERGFAVATQGNSTQNFCAFVAGATSSNDVTTVAPIAGGEQHQGGADALLLTLCDHEAQPSASWFSKTVSSTNVVAGQNVTYTLIVNNDSDVPVPVTVTDPISTRFSVVSTSGPGCGRTGNTVTCNFVAQPGVTAISITVRAGTTCNVSAANTATLTVLGQSFSASSSNVFIACPPPLCGNGVINPGEQCDGTANCRLNCTIMVCGDGIVDAANGEQCEGANNCDPATCRTVNDDGDTCVGTDNVLCEGTTVCGAHCGVVEDCGLFGCDAYLLCSTPYRCMPPAEASVVVGQ